MEFLTKFSLVISILLIFILLILSNSKLTEPKLVKISDIKEKQLNKKVKISGNIASIKNYEGFNIIKIKDSSGEIEVILNLNNKEANLTKIKQENQTLEITGRVDIYRNKTQISAEKIIII